MDVKEIKKKVVNDYMARFPEEVASKLNSFSENEALFYIQSQLPKIASRIITRLDRNFAARVIQIMDDNYFVTLCSIVDPYKIALILSVLDQPVIITKLALLPKKLSEEIKELITYPEESAGHLMDTNVYTFLPENTVKDVLKKLRLIKDRKLTNIYVVNQESELLGKVSVQDIAISPPGTLVESLMEKSLSIHVMSPYEEIVEILKDNKLIGLPVVDLDNRLLGIIRNDVLFKTAQQEAIEDVQTMFGAGREERALSRVGFAVKKRLPWLEINLATAFLASAVVGMFEETIAQITILAVFLPVVAGQSGNTGSQALAVTMRGLALREIRPSQWLKVARKEASVGFINGVAVAITTSIIVYFWASSYGLALIIGVSMIASMVIAGFSGAVIPMILKSIGQDPAQSSSIVLTTVTDIVGFMSFLGLATVLGAMLGIM